MNKRNAHDAGKAFMEKLARRMIGVQPMKTNIFAPFIPKSVVRARRTRTEKRSTSLTSLPKYISLKCSGPPKNGDKESFVDHMKRCVYCVLAYEKATQGSVVGKSKSGTSRRIPIQNARGQTGREWKLTKRNADGTKIEPMVIRRHAKV